jgi:GT2 family glycosyltransferase
MYGEDIAFCQKWRSLGEKVYIDPSITCSHVGKKEWRGNFSDYLKILEAYK